MSQPPEAFQSTVVKADPLTPRVKLLRLEVPAGQTFTLASGQHIQLHIPTPAGPKKGYFSVASAPQEAGYFDLCVTFVEGSPASGFVHALKAGDHVSVSGPFGSFHLESPISRDVLFIATGSGIAPLRSMIWDLYHRKFDKQVCLLFGNRTEDDIIYKDEWNRLEKSWPGFKAIHVLSQPTDSWKGLKGRVNDHIDSFLTEQHGKDFYLCGQSPMVKAMKEKLLSLRVPDSHIHFERY